MLEETLDRSLCERCVIFLDVDGVLLPVPRFTFGGGELNSSCVAQLRRIIDDAGGKDRVTIILSSTWRNSPELVGRLQRYFEEVAGNDMPCITGGTPNGTVITSQVHYYADNPSEQRLVRDRVDEISRWLRMHIVDHPEAIAGRWLAIDDMQLDVDERMAGHFLKTETEAGLTDASVIQAREVMSSFPTIEITIERARRALVDPVLKDEEIMILKIRCDRLQEEVNALGACLSASKDEAAGLLADRHELERELKSCKTRIEDMDYRLALTRFSKKNKVLAAVLEYAATTSGQERKTLDAKVKSLVTLLRLRRELKKAVEVEARRGLPKNP